MNEFEIILTAQAQEDLAAISDQKTKEAIVRKTLELKTEPDKRGKPLTGNLKKYYSVRAAGQRYRTVYEVYAAESIVLIVVIGIRKAGHKQDAYEIARKRLE